MGLDPQTIGVLAILFVAASVRATFGFGDALVAMPLLVITVGVKTAAPLVALNAVTLALTMLLQHWRDVRVSCGWRLLVAGAVGTPVGMLFLRSVYEAAVACILGCVIVAFSMFSLVTPSRGELKHQRWAFGFGLLAGVLGGAYNTNGPPLVVYGTLKRWTPEEFRATLQGYFFPAGLLIITCHAAGGFWSHEVFRLYLLSLPVMGVALVAGRALHRVVLKGKFDRYVHVLLIALGLYLIAHTLWGGGQGR